jgi:hypothetical protein
MEGLDLVDQLSVLLCFQFSDRVSPSALYLLAGQRGHELIAAHANVTMDSPDGQNHVHCPEGPVPRDRVVIVRVDQGSVNVENRRGSQSGPPTSDSVVRRSAALAGDRSLELCLAHLGPSVDSEPLGFVVELVARRASRPRASGAKPTTAAGRDVSSRTLRALARLACPRALFLNCPRSDLLGSLLRSPLSFLALLDVLILTSAFRALLDPARGHEVPPLLVLGTTLSPVGSAGNGLGAG